MSLTSRTNRWASRAVVILQLIIWNAIGIFLLQRGVSSLRRKMLETNNIIEINPSIGLGVESTVSSMRYIENDYDLAISVQQQLVDKNAKMIIEINSESPLDNQNRPGLNVIRSTLGDAFEIVTEEERSTLSFLDSLEVPMINQGTPSSPMKNQLMNINQRDLEGKSTGNRISRIARDKERTLANRISEVEKAVTHSESESISQEEETDATGKDSDFVENTSRPTMHKLSTQISSVREKTGDYGVDNLRRNENRIKFSRISNGSAATAVAMVVIGVIMLLLGPAMIILRVFDERRRARQMTMLSATAREDLPPSYEQAVFMSEAPRYSTLALNDDRSSSPTPLPSSSYTFSDFVIKSHST
ncbi:uncharacterized protein [Linepithema humile]|uniref:uncharacterized protein n=1 Tax=Linepithema humile TaxID=83485 RepID=UPI0006236D2A|nr:PREDICTED: uncharacterized protein LOC105674415 [Linepithema humile]XP_012226125.1 PREDICTED: uncharacterized protein LOC105674415 [Linepithema humile]